MLVVELLPNSGKYSGKCGCPQTTLLTILFEEREHDCIIQMNFVWPKFGELTYKEFQ